MIFFTLVCSLSCLTAQYWHLAQGNVTTASRLQIAGGALSFASSAFGWYMWFAIMLAVLDFPFQLPVGDLSATMLAGTRKQERKKVQHEA
jgi:succinate-acetate transporter protein